MSQHATGRRRRIVVAAVAALLTWSCTEDAPTSPKPKPGGVEGIEPSSVLTALTCTANVSTKRVACGPLGTNALEEPAGPAGLGDKANIIIGGQGVFVTVQTSNVDYNAGTGAFTFDAAIRNLIPQPLGTADTIPPLADPHPNGIRIFIAGGPTVTGGTGTITVPSPDGVDAFTGVNQPYYQYSTVLDQFEISSPRGWLLNMPSTVETFTFALLVSAAVPRPDGYIDLQVANNAVTPPTDKPVSYFVRNANGTLAGDQSISLWASSDTTRATIDPAGVINPLRAGQIIVTAISGDGLRVGYITLTVKPIRRTWTGAVSTDWHTRGNWIPDAIVPVVADSVLIPDGLSQYPSLIQNTEITGIDVIGPAGVINQNAFDLTANGNIAMPLSGRITATSGRLILAGFSNTVSGIAPSVLVPGRYSLDANLTVARRVRVQSGRLRAQGFRVRVNPF